jgi:hypothetical protein
VRWILGCLLIAGSLSGDTRNDPILAIPITNEFTSDATIRAYFADLIRKGGYGMWDTERAAFLVREANGGYGCVGWPFAGGFHTQHFDGSAPDGTVAIVHTHPRRLPMPSRGDALTAIEFSVPIFVITPRNIYLVSSRGETIVVVENAPWTTVNASSSIRCSAATAPASRAR